MLIAKFEATADKFSKNTALKTGDREISYGELKQSVDRLARGVGGFFTESPDTPHAALFFNYGSGMITALLAVLKAGGVYVPMDTAYPEKRLEYMLEHSEASVILTDSGGMEAVNRIAGLVNRNIAIINIDNADIDNANVDKTDVHKTEFPLPDAAAGDSSAYILYTSGSTGLPKGVLQTQKNVWYYTRNWIERFAITPSDRMTLLTAFNHDGAVQDIFSALCSGATLVLYDIKNAVERSGVERSRVERSGGSRMGLADFIKEEEITIWHSVPTLFRYFADSLKDLDEQLTFPHLRFVLLGGEALRTHDIVCASRNFPGVMLANVYGQTESSVNCIHIISTDSPEQGYDRPLLGEPLDGTQLFLVDEEGDEVEEFGSGEILVACPHIAAGYWKDPELSAKVFENDDEFGRLYWTGDLGRMTAGGGIELMGRKDHQVKIRGFRVETGEIETALLTHEAVSEAVVVLRQEETGDPFLCAYFVAARQLSVAGIREYLMDRVPDYMVPTHFIQLEKMPLTATGKVDRAKLPQPEVHDGEAAYVAPRDDVEKELAAIWARVLSLDPEEIGIDADFFQLGGHSLKAVTMSLNIHQCLHVRLALPLLFSLSTIRRLAEYIRSADQQRHVSIDAVEDREYYPLTPAQLRLYILHQMEEGMTLYNLPVTVELEGELDERRLEDTFRGIIRRHESLRTFFLNIGGSPFQKIHREVPFEIGTIDSGQLKVRPFDLGRAPLFRVEIKKINPSRWTMLADMHHIVSDGTSMAMLIREFMALYRGEELTQPMVRYRDYSHWLMGESEQGILERQREYWLEMFSGDVPVLNPPLDFPRPPVRRFEGDQVFFRLEAEETTALKQLAKNRGMTLYMTLLGVYAVFLSKICGQEDIVIGTPTAGRGHAQLEHIVGMFVNTLALRCFPRPGSTVRDFLDTIKDTALKSFQNQDYPFEELVERLNLDKDASRNPIFDTMFVLQNFDVRSSGIPEIAIPGLVMRPVVTENRVSKFDLNLTAFEGPDHIQLVMSYCTHLFKRETVERFRDFFSAVARAIGNRPQALLAEIQIISQKEKELILNTFNNPEISSPPGKTIHQCFRDQALKTPHRIALGGYTLKDNRSYWSYRTYKQLDEDSNALAQDLKKGDRLEKRFEERKSGRAEERRKIEKGDRLENGDRLEKIIAIRMERSIDYVSAILAVLKTGAAYLPIDPNLPEERIDYMINDSNAILVNNEQLTVIGKTFTGHCSLLTGHCSLAYVIYTSGSTGRPKGVMVEHGGVIRLTSQFNSKILGHLETPLTVGLMAPFAFDASVLHMFGALLSGNRLDIVPDNVKMDGTALLNFIERRQLNVLEGAPTHLAMMLEAVETVGFPAHLKHIITGGDVLTRDLVKRMTAVLGDKMPALTNMYGPTECTVAATAFTITPGNTDDPEIIPIGKPIINYIIHILDQNGLHQPIGIPGELHIAGPGIARGYLNNPELTNSKFLNSNTQSTDFSDKRSRGGVGSPLERGARRAGCVQTRTSALIYRTGDIGRWLPDGNIQFLGRRDHQVKVRGFRIELGEIENRLKAHPYVKDAVVIEYVTPGGDNVLGAYVVTEPANIEPESFRDFLAAHLPAYMIPSYFVSLEKLPLTASGKINRNVLPEPGVAQSNADLLPPNNEIERELVVIWSGVLGLEIQHIGRESNFFELGGNSLKASVMAARTHKQLGVPLPLTEVFKAPTVAGLAGVIERTENLSFQSIPKAREQHSYALSAAQKRLYVLQNMDEANMGYNITSGVTLEGRLDIEKLSASFGRLVQRHESLRTSFVMEDGEPRQRIHEDVEFEVEFKKIRSRDVMEVLDSFVRPFELSRPPLLRVGVFQTESQTHLLIMDIHHTVSDGTSCALLVREFTALYSGVEPAPVALRYRDFSQWQNSPLQQRRIRGQKDFWLEVFNETPEPVELPLDFPRPAVQSFDGAAFDFNLDPQETAGMKQLAQAGEATLFMTLLAVYVTLLWRLSGQRDIVTGTPTAGRSHADLENVTGMFINTLALRFFPEGDTSFEQLLAAVKNHTLAAFENQDYPFEELVNQLSVPRDTGRHPLFDTMFSLQNFEVADVGDMDGGEIPTLPVPEISVKPLAYEKSTTHFDLDVTALERQETIFFRIDYCRKLFKAETIRRLSRYFKRIAGEVVLRPQVRLAEIEILTPQEKDQLLTKFNNTAIQPPQFKAIHDLFSEQAKRNPDHTALAGTEKKGDRLENPAIIGKDNRSYWSYRTYKQLDRESSWLAGSLAKKGARPGKIVAIKMERSLDLVTTVLAVLKTGAAYLPIDPGLPEERIDYMLKDSNALLVGGEWWLVAGNKKQSHSHSSPFTPHHSPAYVIYTSGSTGRPKGVMVEHGSVFNLMVGLAELFPMGMDDAYLFKTPFIFDVSVSELLGWIIPGGRLVVLENNGEKDPDQILDMIQRFRVTHINFVPSMFSAFSSALTTESNEKLKTIKYIFLAGEALTPEIVRRFRRINSSITLENLYGPTEATVYASRYSLSQWDGGAAVPIGKPLPNYRAVIFNRSGQLQPIGVAGELCLSGPGLARGYLNNPELTAERFIRLPASQNPQPSPDNPPPATVYKTGDRARWLADGNIQFLGRLDQQVKVRGFRIELGEIESILLAHPPVKEAVVVLRSRPGNQSYLCAYIVSGENVGMASTASGADLSGQLRDHLMRHLPDYMVPPFFVLLDRMPLTAGGKINRPALPEPQLEGEEITGIESSPMEKRLAGLAAKVLGLTPEKIGPEVNLFTLGASSLDMIKLAAAIYKEWDIQISVFTVFRNPAVRTLVRVLAESRFERFEEDNLSVFNPGRQRILWGFPPAIGYGFAYAGLAELLNEYTVYGFNFIPDNERLDRYVDLMTKHQPEGPYTLFSYSAGGELTVEVANRLEQKGHEVASLLLLDCYRTGAIPGGQGEERFPDRFMETVEHSMKELGVEYLKDRVSEKIAAYSDYFHEVRQLKPVRADIHLLKAHIPEKRIGEPVPDAAGWQELVRKDDGGHFLEYQASGLHGEILEGEHLEKNAASIRSILELNESRHLLSSHREIHGRLSRIGAAFLDFVKHTPEALDFSNFTALDIDDELVCLQPWPLFVNQTFKREMAEASVEVCRLIKSLPYRLFNNDVSKISKFYELPVHMIEAQLRNSDEDHLELLLGRGDFLWTRSGFKCLEFNITASLGGIDLPAWLRLYRNVPVISKFIENHKVKISNGNLHELFLAHMIRSARRTVNREPDRSTLNAALVIDGIGVRAKAMESFLSPLYKQQLKILKPGIRGTISVCDYPDVTVHDNTVFANGIAVDVLVEMYNGVVPPEILELEHQKRVTVLNGPITGLMTNKLNLALLSEYKDSERFQPREKELIDKYIPWSRKTIRGGETARGKTPGPDGTAVNLEEYLYNNKDRLILKPSAGYGGTGIVIGKNTSKEEWGQSVTRAFKERRWLAQEYISPLPLVYQSGQRGCGQHDVVWGLFVLGDVYAGNALRLLPRGTGDGVINAARGAVVGVVFEVDED